MEEITKYFLYLDIEHNFYQMENSKEIKTESSGASKKLVFATFEEMLDFLKQNYGKALIEFREKAIKEKLENFNFSSMEVDFSLNLYDKSAEGQAIPSQVEELHSIYIEKHKGNFI